MSGWERGGAHNLDCKTVGFFLKLSKEIGKAWRKSLTRAKRASLIIGCIFVFKGGGGGGGVYKREFTVVYQ